MACCDLFLITNTGVTEDIVNYYNCNNDLVTFTAQTDFTYYIDGCFSGGITGNTISVSNSGSISSYYLMSGCCTEKDTFIFYGQKSLINVGDTIYSDLIMSTIGDGPDLKGCYVCIDAGSIAFTPPGYPSYDFISTVSGDFIYKNCEDCLAVHSCYTDCYGLFSCDGSYEFFTSFNPLLSGYVDSFINIELLSPLTGTPETAFLVKLLDTKDCKDQTLNILSSADKCECQCYSYRVPEQVITLSYVDCDLNLIETYLPTGQTFSVCSVVKPILDVYPQIPPKIGGSCVDNTCPEITVPSTIIPRNECDVLTIFPMEVSCIVRQPSEYGAYDGSATLFVTGGTPPYTIIWDSGSISPTILNLTTGSYGATVTDFYGDFIINTECVLTAETTTTTTSTTTLPPATYDKLCVVLTVRGKNKLTPFEYEQIELDPNGTINGVESWISSDTQYLLSWVTGNTNQWTLTGYPSPNINIVNNNSSVPPLVGWQALGSFEIVNVVVLSGACTPQSLVGFTYTKNDPICDNTGSIVIQAYGGVPPYEYSIDNGVTYGPSPIFQNLSQGTYTMYVKDSNGVVIIQTTSLTQQPIPTYTIFLSVNTVANTFSITCPGLQPGETMTFDLNNNSNLQYYPSTLTPAPSYNNTVTISSFGPMTLVSTTNNQNILSLPCSVTPVTQNQQTKGYSNTLTIGYGQTITGSFTNSIVNPSSGDCVLIQNNYQLYITNASINNCACCPVIINNPPLPSFLTPKI